MSKIVAIEGICCAGKSTLCENLSKTSHTTIVPEYGTYGVTFPPRATDESSLRANFDFFNRIERIRSNSVKAEPDGQLVVLDRSFITCCAHDYAETRNSPLASTLPTIEAWWRHSEHRLVPILVVTLRITETVFRERLARCGRNLQPPLTDWDFNSKFYGYLESIPSRWGIETQIVDVDCLSPDEVAAAVRTLVEDT